MEIDTGRKLFSVLGGIVLIISGLYVFINPLYVPTLITLTGVFMLIAGVVLIFGATKTPLTLMTRNIRLADGILMFLIGILFAFIPSQITETALGYALLFWFIWTSIIQIILACKVISDSWMKWAVIVLAVIVIVLSIYGMTSIAFVWSMLYFVIAFQFIFLGVSWIFQALL